MSAPVFILLDSSAVGGIESHVMMLAKTARQHCDVSVLLWRQYHHTEHPLVRQLAAVGIRCLTLDGSFYRLYQLLAIQQDAILHCHGYKANLLGRLWALYTGRRCVCTFHNGDIGQGRVRLYTWLDELTARFSKNIAVSKQIAQRLHSHCTLLPNAVELGPFHLSVSSHKAIALVGRLETVKRPERFLQLAAAFPARTFELWGSGSLMSALAKTKTSNVHLHGAVPSMQPYWSVIDLLVICSDHEGLPMVALEGMAQGVPVLCLPLGDLPVLIRHGENGLIAQTPADLAVHLQHWLQLSTELKLRMRLRARQTIEQEYSSEQYWPRLAKVYYE